MNLFLNQWKENVKKYGSRPAIVDRDGTRETTYSELDALSGRICTALKKRRDCGKFYGRRILCD